MVDIENRLLRYFVAVAEERHFAQAALRLGISPPTLTHQIQKLESQLGAKLLRRKGNTKVALTSAGERLLTDAREVLRHLEQASANVRKAGRGELGSLKLGFVTLLSNAGLMGDWIGAFQSAHPQIDISMDKMAPMAQITALLQGELDAGFTRTPQKYPPGLNGFEIHRQRLVLAVPRSHALARVKAINPALLVSEKFVSFPPEIDVGFFGFTEIVARLGGFVPRVVKRMDDFTVVLAYVSARYGIAVVPELMTRINVPNVVFREIEVDPVPQISMAFVYGRSPSPSTKLLIRHMQRHASRNGGKGAAPPHNHDSIVLPSALNLDRYPGALGPPPSRLGAASRGEEMSRR